MSSRLSDWLIWHVWPLLNLPPGFSSTHPLPPTQTAPFTSLSALAWAASSGSGLPIFCHHCFVAVAQKWPRVAHTNISQLQDSVFLALGIGSPKDWAVSVCVFVSYLKTAKLHKQILLVSWSPWTESSPAHLLTPLLHPWIFLFGCLGLSPPWHSILRNAACMLPSSYHQRKNLQGEPSH